MVIQTTHKFSLSSFMMVLAILLTTGCAGSPFFNNYMCPPGAKPLQEDCPPNELQPLGGAIDGSIHGDIVGVPLAHHGTPASDLAEIYQQLESLTASTQEIREQLGLLDKNAVESSERQAQLEMDMEGFMKSVSDLQRLVNRQQNEISDLDGAVRDQDDRSKRIMTTVESHLDDMLLQFEDVE